MCVFYDLSLHNSLPRTQLDCQSNANLQFWDKAKLEWVVYLNSNKESSRGGLVGL